MTNEITKEELIELQSKLDEAYQPIPWRIPIKQNANTAQAKMKRCYRCELEFPSNYGTCPFCAKESLLRKQDAVIDKFLDGKISIDDAISEMLQNRLVEDFSKGQEIIRGFLDGLVQPGRNA